MKASYHTRLNIIIASRPKESIETRKMEMHLASTLIRPDKGLSATCIVKIQAQCIDFK